MATDFPIYRTEKVYFDSEESDIVGKPDLKTTSSGDNYLSTN